MPSCSGTTLPTSSGRIFEVRQAFREHRITDPTHRALEFGESRRPVQQRAENDAVPPFAQEAERAGQSPVTCAGLVSRFALACHPTILATVLTYP